MGGNSSKADMAKEPGYENFVQDYKNKHPELNDEQLQVCCMLEWGKMSPEQKSLYQNTPSDESVVPPVEENAQNDENVGQLPQVVENTPSDESVVPPVEENAQNDENVGQLPQVVEEVATCSVVSQENQPNRRPRKLRACKANSCRSPTKPYDRPAKPRKTEKSVKAGQDRTCLPLTDNGFLNYLRQIRAQNTDLDDASLAKVCREGWTELSEEQKNEYRKRRD